MQTTTTATVASYVWTYNADNTVATFTNAEHSSENASYTYDATGQLTAATYINDTSLNTTSTYDFNGNKETTGQPNDGIGTNNEVTSDGTYTYSYDPAGNLTQRTAANGSYSNSYDNRNRLTLVTSVDNESRTTQTVAYTYDSFNRLVSRMLTQNTYTGDSTTPASTTTTAGRFIYDGDNIVLQLDDSANVVDRVLWGAAVDQVAQESPLPLSGNQTVQSSGTTTWALSDNQNTVRDLVQYNSSSGTTTVVDHRTYSAFLVPLSTPTVDFLFGYTGKYYDTATGLQWNLNRWYNPQLQRWMSQDPLGLEPDSNAYRYCDNGPTDRTDPSGLAPILDWKRKGSSPLGGPLASQDWLLAYTSSFDSQLIFNFPGWLPETKDRKSIVQFGCGGLFALRARAR